MSVEANVGELVSLIAEKVQLDGEVKSLRRSEAHLRSRVSDLEALLGSILGDECVSFPNDEEGRRLLGWEERG